MLVQTTGFVRCIAPEPLCGVVSVSVAEASCSVTEHSQDIDAEKKSLAAGSDSFCFTLLPMKTQTTAPSVSSLGFTGLIRSSRFAPSHIATAAATNTEE